MPGNGSLVLGFLALQVVEDRLDDEVVHRSIPLLAQRAKPLDRSPLQLALRDEDSQLVV